MAGGDRGANFRVESRAETVYFLLPFRFRDAHSVLFLRLGRSERLF
jgi:hypothetical protein